MTWTIIAVLIIVGFLFLLLEILALPGTSIAGVIGFVMIGIGVWQAYAVHGGMAGTLTLVGSLILSVIALYFALKSNTWKRASLSSNINSRVNIVEPESIKPGDTGKTVSRLAPMGKAMINNAYYEVRTKGEYIDQGTEIEVVKVDVNKITVKIKT
jgi:membrane-bound ClpP family serine protease